MLQLHLWALILLIGVGITTSNARAASSAPDDKETTTTPDVSVGDVVSFLRDAPPTSADEDSDADQEQVGETSDDTDDEEVPKVKHHHHVHVHLKGSKTTKKPRDCEKKVTSTPYPTIKEDIKKNPDQTSSTTVEPKSLSGKLLHHRVTTLSPSKNMTSNQTGIDFSNGKRETTVAAATTTQLPASASNSSESVSPDDEDEDSEGEEQDEQDSSEDYTEEGEYRIKSQSNLGEEKENPALDESSNSSSSGVSNSVKVDLKKLPVNPSTQKPTKKQPSITVKPLTNKNVKSPK